MSVLGVVCRLHAGIETLQHETFSSAVRNAPKSVCRCPSTSYEHRSPHVLCSVLVVSTLTVHSACAWACIVSLSLGAEDHVRHSARI